MVDWYGDDNGKKFEEMNRENGRKKRRDEVGVSSVK